jgi:hypothetical protein
MSFIEFFKSFSLFGSNGANLAFSIGISFYRLQVLGPAGRSFQKDLMRAVITKV